MNLKEKVRQLEKLVEAEALLAEMGATLAEIQTRFDKLKNS